MLSVLMLFSRSSSPNSTEIAFTPQNQGTSSDPVSLPFCAPHSILDAHCLRSLVPAQGWGAQCSRKKNWQTSKFMVSTTMPHPSCRNKLPQCAMPVSEDLDINTGWELVPWTELLRVLMILLNYREHYDPYQSPRVFSDSNPVNLSPFPLVKILKGHCLN